MKLGQDLDIDIVALKRLRRARRRHYLEAEIRKHPECWLWMYKQWRYRPVGELSVPHPDYPQYSNLSDALIGMIPEALRPQTQAG